MAAPETAIVFASVALVVGYHLYLIRQLLRSPEKTVLGLARAHRRSWVKRIIQLQDGILAVQTLRNWTMNSSFLASTAIIIGAGLLGFLLSADKVSGLVHELNLLGATGSQLLTFKFLLLIANFFAAFFNFSLALRYYNHVALTINIAEDDSPSDAIETSYRYLERGAWHYTVGMRGYYLAIPMGLWLFGPVWLATGAILVTVALYRHDHI